MLAIWLGLGLLASSGTEPEPTPTPEGAGRPLNYRESWEQHQRRTHWEQQAEEYVAPEPKKAKKAVVPQAAQDAPQQPRMAEPAPIEIVRPSQLDTLLWRAGQLPAAQLLADAMLRRMQADIVQAAIQAEADLAAEEEAVAMMLVLMGNV